MAEYYPAVFEGEAFNCPYCNVYAKQHWRSMMVPAAGNVELPNPDMPEDCKSDYMEARSIVNLSPKGAPALKSSKADGPPWRTGEAYRHGH